MKISFIILNWHNEDDTIGCVKTVDQLRGNFQKQIIIVDNETTRKGFKQLSSLKHVQFVRNDKNLGFAGGVNSGLAHVDGEYTALLNNDMIVQKDWAIQAVKAITSQPNVAVVGGKEFDWDASNPAGLESNSFMPTRLIDFDNGVSVASREIVTTTTKVACLTGGNMFLDTSIFKQIRGLDNDFFAYYEETDLCMRLLALGKILIYEPSMKVWHKRNISTAHLPYFRLYLASRNRLTLIAKNFPNDTWRRLLRKALSDYIVTALLGKRGGIRSYRKASNTSLNFIERKALFVAALWGVWHYRFLVKKRKQNQAAGTFSNDIGYIGRKLQKEHI